MKRLFVFLLIFIPMMLNAQRVDKPGEPYEVYCVVYIPSISKVITITIPNHESSWLYESNGREIRIKHFSDGFLYLSKLGWKYVEDIGNDSYLFKKQVYSDNEIKEGMYLKEDFKETKKR